MSDDLHTLTQRDLDDAPIGTVVRAADGTIAARYDRQRGVVFGDDRPFPWKVLQAPAVTLWPRDDRQDRSEDEAIEHERKPRCYIAGPIAGTPDFRARFTDAVPEVEAMGYEPVNPCDITPATHEGDCPPGYDPGANATGHTSSACFMRADLRALLGCDAIYLLPGWRESRGATVEHVAAVACGMRIYTTEDNQ